MILPHDENLTKSHLSTPIPKHKSSIINQLPSITTVPLHLLPTLSILPLPQPFLSPPSLNSFASTPLYLIHPTLPQIFPQPPTPSSYYTRYSAISPLPYPEISHPLSSVYSPQSPYHPPSTLPLLPTTTPSYPSLHLHLPYQDSNYTAHISKNLSYLS